MGRAEGRLRRILLTVIRDRVVGTPRLLIPTTALQSDYATRRVMMGRVCTNREKTGDDRSCRCVGTVQLWQDGRIKDV